MKNRFNSFAMVVIVHPVVLLNISIRWQLILMRSMHKLILRCVLRLSVLVLIVRGLHGLKLSLVTLNRKLKNSMEDPMIIVHLTTYILANLPVKLPSTLLLSALIKEVLKFLIQLEQLWNG